MNDWEFSDEARDAGRDVPDLDEKALVIEGRVNLGVGDEPNWSRSFLMDEQGRTVAVFGPEDLWAEYRDLSPMEQWNRDANR